MTTVRTLVRRAVRNRNPSLRCLIPGEIRPSVRLPSETLVHERIRMRPALLLLGLLSLLPTRALAQGTATIVYDVKLREFTCWTEGALTPPLKGDSVCAAPWYPI